MNINHTNRQLSVFFFCAVLASSIPLFSGAEENTQSYFGSMLGSVGILTKKAISSTPSMMKKLLASTMILLATTSGATVRGCWIPIELNPDVLPTCYHPPIYSPHAIIPWNAYQLTYQKMLMMIAACKSGESHDCVDVCSSHKEDIHRPYNRWIEFLTCPEHMPQESIFTLCPADFAGFEQGLIDGKRVTFNC